MDALIVGFFFVQISVTLVIHKRLPRINGKRKQDTETGRFGDACLCFAQMRDLMENWEIRGSKIFFISESRGQR